MSFDQPWIFTKEQLAALLVDPKDAVFRYRKIWFLEDLVNAIYSSDDRQDKRVFPTACVYFHRFFVFHRFKQHESFIVAAACIFLASKVEEKVIRINELTNKYLEVRYPKQLATPEKIKETSKDIILNERLLLNSLNFDLVVPRPHQYLNNKVYLGYIEDSYKIEFSSKVAKFINDSFRTTLCLTYPLSYIAYAAYFITAQLLELKPHNHYSRHDPYSQELTWVQVMEKDIDEATLKKVAIEILDLYSNYTTIVVERAEFLNSLNENLKRDNGSHLLEGEDDSLPPPPPDEDSTMQGTEDDDSFFNQEESKPSAKVTVTKIIPSKGISQDISFSNESPIGIPPPPCDTPSNDSVMSYYQASESNPEETPNYVPPPPSESPSPFVDVTKLAMLTRMRSSSFSESEDFTKRPRLDSESTPY